MSAVADLHGQKQSPNVTCDSMHCTGRWAVRSALSLFEVWPLRLKERRREEVISRNNRVLDEVSQARIVVSYVERRSG